MSHTPGPWTAAVRLTASENHRGWIVRADGMPVAWEVSPMLKMDGDESHKEAVANAALIAAAPDLLEALRGLMPAPLTGDRSDAELIEFWTRENELGRGEAPAVLAAYAAIAKATEKR